MDAIARALGVDAVEFRLKHLKDERMRAVLHGRRAEDRLAEALRRRPRARHRVRHREGQLRRDRRRVSAAPTADSRSSDWSSRSSAARSSIPDGLHNQVEGSVVQGLGGALFEAIEFANGQLLNGSMAQYRVPRFKDMPADRDRAARSPGPSVGRRRRDADRLRRAGDRIRRPQFRHRRDGTAGAARVSGFETSSGLAVSGLVSSRPVRKRSARSWAALDAGSGRPARASRFPAWKNDPAADGRFSAREAGGRSRRAGSTLSARRHRRRRRL